MYLFLACQQSILRGPRCRPPGLESGAVCLLEACPPTLIRRATAMGVAARTPVMSLQKEFQGYRGMQTTGGTGFLERATGIEPVSEAWEALNKTLKEIELAALSFPSDSLTWKLD